MRQQKRATAKLAPCPTFYIIDPESRLVKDNSVRTRPARYADRVWIENAPDWDALREDPGYSKITSQIRD